MKQLFRFSVLLLASILPATATAYDFEVDGIYYRIFYNNNNACFVTDADNYSGTPDYSGDVTIPETVTYDGISYSVTSIGEHAFYNCRTLTSVNIPNSITNIGYCAFYGCSGLTNLSIPNSVTSIDDLVFAGCSSLSSITVDNDNTKYDSRDNCNAIIETSTNTLETGCMNTIIPNTVTAIGNSAFDCCIGLTSVTIPNSVTTIGYYAFSGCSGLTSLIIGNSVTSICDYAFSYCNMLTSLTIGSFVSSIGEHAFYGCSGLTNLSIPNSVTSIGDEAFSGCSGLTNLSIPNSVTSIGSSAFSDCSSLTNLSIGSSVTSIGQYAFFNCSGLTSIQVESTNLAYDSRDNCNAIIETTTNTLILGCNNTTIPNSVTSIGKYAFYECGRLTNLRISDSVTSIGDYAFYNCNGLSSLTIGNSVKSIGEFAFYRCSNIHTLFFNAVNCNFIGRGAFASNISYNYTINYEIKYLQFGDSVQYIPDGLPRLDMGGNTLMFPNSVNTISAGAINGNCAAVVIGNGIENIFAGSFPSSISVAYATSDEPLPCESKAFVNPQTLYVPSGSRIKYFTAPGWCEFTNIFEDEYIPATAIELDRNNATLNRDAALHLSATIRPDSATTSSICWYSLNPNIAYVYGDGVIFANGVGETDIIVWVDQVSDTCHIKVTPIMVENIVLSANHLSMAPNETLTLTANVSPGNAENKTLEWIIPENDVLLTQQVTGTSLNIGALGEGTVTITVQATDGSGVSAFCEVFVSANTPVKNLTLSPETLNLYVGYSEQLNAIITPQDAYIQELRWMSSNTSVATVDNNGRVTGCGVGNATITAVTTDGSNLSATCVVTVTNIPVESVTLDCSEIEMYEGNSTYLYATVLPYNAMNQTLRWESSNPRVATVSSNGRVNALEVGTTIITASSTDGTDISAACRINVINYMTSNCFSMPDSDVLHGESVTIPVRLTNDQDILAFQTNIYLPEGFTMATNEDDEFIITPSDRLTSDHILMADRLGDGGIRVICYTPQEVPISGYEGDLFYITITAPEYAAHDYAINLRNSLLTNTYYQELTIPDAGAVLTVNTFMMGDANDSHSVTVTDIVVTAQYVLGRNPSPFIFEAADMNGDDNITVTDIMLIVYLINHPTINMPKRMPALEGGNDSMSGEDVTLMAGETRKVSIQLNNEMDYTAFQLDLQLPDGLTASNFQLTDRACSHAFDVNTLGNGKTRALCYSPAIEVIDGHEGDLLTFDVTATDDIKGIITVDGIELVTADCQTVLMNSFTIGVNSATSVNELNGAKTVAGVDYFNLAGQQIDHPGSGVTIVVTTYTDGTRSTTKVIK